MLQGSAPAMEKSTAQKLPVTQLGNAPGFVLWLHTWSQVLIAELLHLSEGRQRDDA